MESSPHILVVDDHRDIRDLLAKYLAKHGLRVTTASDGVDMKRALRAGAIDLVVLDIMMPGEDGLSLCRHLRETTALPVILLTAMAEDTDRVVGLEIGADDYVTKPFNPRELLARIKAVLRRAHSLPPEAGAPGGLGAMAAGAADGAAPGRLRFGPWVLDLAQRALIDQAEVVTPLSTGEFRLLQALVSRPGMVLSRDQLLDLTRGRSAKAFDRSVDNQVSRLRRKIEPDPRNPTLIKTVWGGGYSFVGKVEPA